MRILIATITAGGGHLQAAAALQEAWLHARPQDTVQQLDLLNPIPGQEAANSDFLLERGAASKINRVEDLPFRIEQLLGSKKLAGMARAAAALGRPAAAADICRAVIARLHC